MRKLILTSIAGVIATTAMADGTVQFKTSITHDPVFYTTSGDQVQSELALVGTDGTAGVFGTVYYMIYTAPVGTPLKIGPIGLPDFSAWTGTPVGPVAYSSPGVINPSITIDIPPSSGAAGSPVQMEIFAYTGTLNSPTSMGMSGVLFNGSTTITYNGTTTSVGAFGWSQATGNPNGIPPTTPGNIVTGPTGFGSIVLSDGPFIVVPEPSTLAIGGLGIAALSLLRKRQKG